MKIAWYFVLIAIFLCYKSSNAGTFVVDYPNHQFLKDGKPFRYIAGEIHYFRIHPNLWNDRLKRVRAAGVNAIQTYIPWNLHEPYPGKFDFSDILNLTRFFDLAQQNGLYVLLRAGPFIAAEWEFGGLPWWLLRYGNITLRSSDPNYLSSVRNFYTTLLPIIQPYLYKNNGPILMVQVENEFGNPRCDHNYTYFLRDLFWEFLGNDTVIYTTDQPNDHATGCGHINGTLATVDFSPVAPENFSQIDNHFAVQNKFNGGGPNVCSEFYPGWFVNWNQSAPHPRPFSFIENINYIYSKNASFSIYMFHGGTNFEFNNGAGGDTTIITSYDYGAPVAENGAITQLYKDIRSWIQSLNGWEQPPLAIPENNTASNYGQIPLKRIGTNLISTLTLIQETCQHSTEPQTFEEHEHPYGFVLYSATITTGGKNLSAPNIRDYGYVFLNNVYQGMMINMIAPSPSGFHNTSLAIYAQPGDIIRIIVENRSRATGGIYLDTKGLHPNITLDYHPIQDWYSCGINLTKSKIDKLISDYLMMESEKEEVFTEKASSAPGVYVGQFDVDVVQDTFFDSTGWTKGQLFINGYNIGRYWPAAGPQVTLYIPSPYLQLHNNTVLLIELMGGQQNYANFIDHPIFNWRDTSF